MATSTTSEIKKMINIKARRLLILFLLSILSIGSTLAQPVWNSGPTVTPFPMRLELSFNIDRASNVYYFVLPEIYNSPISQGDVLSYATLVLPVWEIIDNGVISYTGGLVGTNYTRIITGFTTPIVPNHDYTVYVMAREISNGQMTLVSRSAFRTPLCPALDIAFGYTQPQQCVNKGAMLQLNFFPGDPNPDLTGIYPGTAFYIDWGDGNTVTWLSTVLLQVPPLATRQNTYSATIKCNQEVIITVTSSCNPLIVKQFKTAAIIHGRDVNTDGDGNLLIVDNSTGASATIQVCEGNSSTITIKDMSTWDCQNPTYINGAPAPANTDPRTVQWLYGIDDGGVLQNTIGQTLGLTPNVVIGGANNAIRTIQGYTQPIITPATYQGELSQTILIPASCRAGEIFNVYLRNWNKCSIYGVDAPVVTQIQILVVASPPAPTVANRTICFGDVRTLTVTSPPVGTINWYSDALLTTLVGTGINYTPVQTAVGSYPFWVVDKSLIGLLCQSLSTPVTLTINPIPNQPTITRNNADFCFDGVSSIILTANPAAPPAVSGYQWYRNGVVVVGATASTITLSTVAQSGNYTVISYGIAPTLCPSPVSAATTVNIWALATTTIPAAASVCQTFATSFGITAGGAGSTIQWQRFSGGWVNITGAATPNDGCTYSNFTTATLNITNAVIGMNGFQYRAVLTTVAGGCVTTSGAAILTVNLNPTVNAGGAVAAICQGATTAALGGGFGGGATSAVWTDGGVGGSFTNNGGATPNTTTYTAAAAAPASVTLTLTTAGGSCGTTSANNVLTVNPNPTVNVGGAMVAICQGGTSAALGGSFAGGATSAVWTDGGAGGTFANNAGATPNTATYTAAAGSGTPVTLRLTTAGGSCGTIFATKNITINPNPTVNAGGAVAAICQGATTAVLGGSYGGSATSAVWSDGGAGGSFTNNGGGTPNTTTYTAAAAAPASVTLTLTTAGGLCGAVTASKVLTVNPNHAVNAGGAMVAICQGGTSAALGGSFAGGATSAVWTDGGAGGTFANNAGAPPNTATYTASAGSGTPVTLRLTTAGGPCGTIFATKNITVNPNPTVNAGGAVAAICQSGTTLGMGGSYGGSATSAVWSDGGAGGSFTNNGGGTPNTTTYTAAAAAPASVTLTLTTAGGLCGTTSANKILTVNPNPTVNVGGAMVAICQGGTSAVLGGSFRS